MLGARRSPPAPAARPPWLGAPLSCCRSPSRPLPSLLPGRAACALAACRAPGAPPPSAPGVPAVRLAVLRAGLTFLPPVASGWWVGLPDHEVPSRVLAKGPLGTAGLARLCGLALGRTAPGLAGAWLPGEGEFFHWLRLARWELPPGRRTGHGTNGPRGIVRYCSPGTPFPPAPGLQKRGAEGKERCGLSGESGRRRAGNTRLAPRTPLFPSRPATSLFAVSLWN